MKIPKFKFRKKQTPLPTRITNETVAEHRERILAGGRRFKYPVQYAKRRLVINTILISLAAIILTLIIGWWQLYVAQNTSGFFYQVTKVLPLPVAQVDGEPVRYSDYLMQYRGSVYFSENIEGVSLSGREGEEQRKYYKRMALDNAITDSYAAKLAHDLGISVGDEELEKLVETHLSSNGGQLSRKAYIAVINDQYGWNEDEYLRALERQLIRQKVSVAVDDEAEALKDKLEKLIAPDGSNFEQVAEEYKNQVVLEASGMVKHSNADGGRAAVALDLTPGQVSKPFISRSIDGYYIIKLLEKNDTEVSYLSIKVPLKKFSQKLDTIKKQGGVKEYIKVPSVQAPTKEEGK